MAASRVFRSLPLKLLGAYDADGAWVDLDLVKAKISGTITVVTDAVDWYHRSGRPSREYYGAVGAGVHPDTGEVLGIKAPHEFARALGHRFFEVLPPEMLAKSRVERLILHQLMAAERTMATKYEAFEGESRLSSGWARTLDMNRPTPARSINLGAVNAQFATRQVKGNRLHLKMACYDQWFTMVFRIPKSYQGLDVSLPVITDTPSGLVFTFATARERLYPEVSAEFAVGIDVGKVYPYVATVVNQVGEVVETQYPSRRIMALRRDVEQATFQVKQLRKKTIPPREEIARQRQAASRKKRELTILAAQEILDLAIRYGGAVMGMEDLGWVANTMANGRWARGLLKKWVEHYANQQGLLVYEVNAADTSQNCPRCPAKVTHVAGRRVKCACGYTGDRDELGSTNVALRVRSRAKKSAQTRQARCLRDKSGPTPRRVPPRRSTFKKGVKPARTTPCSLVPLTWGHLGLSGDFLGGDRDGQQTDQTRHCAEFW